MKPTPNVFSFVEEQELSRTCLLDAGPIIPPGANSGTQYRGPISPTAQNEVLRAAFWKGRLSSGTHHSPNAPLLSKATLAFFSPSPRVSIGQRGSGLPLTPWALLLCWWSPELESHSKRVLLRGEAGVFTKMSSGGWPHHTSRSQLGSSAPRPHLTHRSKLYSGSSILER